MPDSEKKRVNLRIDPETKSEWESHVDDSPEVNSLSQLIRLAMARHIATESGAKSVQDQPTTVAFDSETKEAINRIERKVEDVADGVGSVQSQLEAEYEFADPKQVVNSLLPEVPASRTQGPDIGEVGMTAEEIAGKIGADTADVRATLDDVEELSPLVKRYTQSRASGEPEQRFVKVEE